MYLAAIIDWHSKKILSWKLSNTMDITLTTSILNEALAFYPKPEIFNTDQGSQYTAKAHINILQKKYIKGLATLYLKKFMQKYFTMNIKIKL